MNLQEQIRKVLKEEIIPSINFRRRMSCYDEFVNKLENNQIVDIPIIRNHRLEWFNYQIILTAYMRAYCDSSGFYDEDIHQEIIDYYGDRLYEWFKKKCK